MVQDQQTFGFSSSRSGGPAPILPPRLPDAGVGNCTLLTLAGTGGVSRYRVLIAALDGGRFLVLAVPLTDVQSTLRQLVLLEGSIGGAVLLATIGLSLLIVRLGLRSLECMGRAAQAIAGGDLRRRVEPATPRTEIGRLGVALNAMLNQIEQAFAERTASEWRLRRFLADASHELRTPLTSIRGYAEMLRRGAERSPADFELARRRIEAEAVRMSALVDDLLLLARLDRGRPLERQPLDLASIVGDACDDARAAAPDRTITLTATPAVVVGDDVRLRQAIGNLMRNALVHTPVGTPIEVSLTTESGRALVTVTDHGPGLPAEARPWIFEPFCRADPGRSRDRGGAGLGLAIVAGVAGAHGGRVRVSDTPGGGASFVIELPLTSDQGVARAESCSMRGHLRLL